MLSSQIEMLHEVQPEDYDNPAEPEIELLEDTAISPNIVLFQSLIMCSVILWMEFLIANWIVKFQSKQLCMF